MKASYYHTITLMANILDQANIPYQYTGRSALFVQGVDIDEYKKISMDVQWDVFNEALDLFPNTRQQSLKEVLRLHSF